jgi:hypothetical protein
MSCPDCHPAFVAGYETGKVERVTADVEDRVRSLLHDQALEALGMARRLAKAKGPSWARMIQECGEPE